MTQAFRFLHNWIRPFAWLMWRVSAMQQKRIVLFHLLVGCIDVRLCKRKTIKPIKRNDGYALFNRIVQMGRYMGVKSRYAPSQTWTRVFFNSLWFDLCHIICIWTFCLVLFLLLPQLPPVITTMCFCTVRDWLIFNKIILLSSIL